MYPFKGGIGGIGGNPLGPNHGDIFIDPLGGGIGGGIGGGNLIGPGQIGIGGGNENNNNRNPPFVPPGARFDPLGPGGHDPDPDHFKPPGGGRGRGRGGFGGGFGGGGFGGGGFF